MTDAAIALPNFERVGAIPESSIQRFSGDVPPEFVELWRQGAGTFADGFLRVVDPAPLEPLLQQGVVLSDGAVPVFVTAFGDIIYCRGGSLRAALFRHGVIKPVTGRPALLPRFLADQGFFDLALHAQLWSEAKAVHGVPDLDECLGFVPMLVLGGRERVDHLKRVKLLEHLDLLTQATGPLA